MTQIAAQCMGVRCGGVDKQSRLNTGFTVYVRKPVIEYKPLFLVIWRNGLERVITVMKQKTSHAPLMLCEKLLSSFLLSFVV